MREVPGRVVVGYIVRPKGVKGEVQVEPLTHTIERFDELSEVVLERDGEPDRHLTVEAWRPDHPGILVKFAGIDSPEVAREALSKGYMAVPPDEVAPLPDGVHYVFEIVGCQVGDESGVSLGRISEVLEMPSSDVYVVQSSEGEVMVPAVSNFIVEISVPQQRVVVRGVDQLFE